MKEIAIIGSGISGLFLANLLRKNPNYYVTIYERNSFIELDDGYGIQLSINSIKLLNEIGFNTFNDDEKFNPEKIDFYEIKDGKKICNLNIAEFNSEGCKYTTFKRSKLIEFLKNKLDDNIIKYNHNITKIESDNNEISLTFNTGERVIFDRLVISDGVFSKGKSLISNNKINPTYNNSVAIRGNISSDNLNNLNEKNISLFLGPDFHYVLYPLNNSKDFNFIGVLKHL